MLAEVYVASARVEGIDRSLNGEDGEATHRVVGSDGLQSTPDAVLEDVAASEPVDGAGDDVPAPNTVTAQVEAEPKPLFEQIVDILAEAAQGCRTDEFGVPAVSARAELRALEELGAVYRTGRTRATRWHLG